MHRSPARPRGRTRRALLAAALPTVLAAVALPGAAEAATLDYIESKGGTPIAFRYVAAPGEVNDVRVTTAPDGRTVVSDSAPIRISGESSLTSCRLAVSGDAICAAGVEAVDVDLGDRNDVIRYQAPDALVRGGIDGGAGDDTIHAGIRRDAAGRLRINGGSGTADTVTYAAAPARVDVSLDDLPNDGHLGDLNDVRSDIEIVEGSAFGDTITGSDSDERERFTGGPGDDRLTGLGGSDVFHEGSAPNGSDTIVGGAGIDLVDFSLRTARVDVRMDDLARNDGEAGEADFIDPNTNDAFGGSGGDFLASGAGASVLIGNAGDDALVGNGGDDRINGGPGRDFLSGGADDDLVESFDTVADTIRCEGGQDTLVRDLRDVDATGCETVDSVGTLALTPAESAVEAGRTARLRVRWSHPESWRKLRSVTLRLRLGDRVVGRVAIRPRGERITGAGAVELVRRSTRLAHEGQTVTARLGLRLDESLAGRTLTADVLATDVRGRRQLERAAGKVRVS